MSETALKFGPEWLRALSHGGSLSSPPSSPGPVRFKLADYRYGREEMLALFSKDFPPPDGLQNLGSLCIEHMQEPLAFLPMNLEEQRIWQRCVNSEAVLRGSGRASINGVGRGRGGSVDRGRGRGRGVGAPYYSRGLSYDEEPEIRAVREGGPPGMSIRNKSYERSQSTGDSRGWVGERTLMERAPGMGEERSGATSPQKGRVTTDNWRARAYEEEMSGDRWRGLMHARNDKWGTRGGWRERDDEAEWDEGRTLLPPPPHMRNSRPPWDADRDKEGQRRHWEDDNLPEWATEAADDKGGSFDATGAFHAPGFSDEDDGEMQEFPPTKDPDEAGRVTRTEKGGPLREEEEGEEKVVEKNWGSDHKNSQESRIKMKTTVRPDDKGPPLPAGNQHHGEGIKPDSGESTSPHLPLVNGILSEEEKKALCSSATPSPPVAPTPKQVPPPTANSFAPTSVPSSTSIQPRLDEGGREEDKLQHMQSVADDLVARLVEDDDPRPLGNARPKSRPPPPGGFLLPEDQWYYTDPQGDIQGPFSSRDMDAWYKAGYFKMTLLLRRQCDDKFAQLGDLTSLFGRIPFQPGLTVPPLKVSDLLTAQKAQAERERYELMQAQVMQKQIYQQQNSLRQQQVLQTLQSLEDWSRLSVAQQQQLFIQQMMALPPLVPPTLPVSLHTATPTTAHSAQSQPSAPELRGALSTSGGPPHLSPQPDPIQAFVAQMATSSSSPPGTTPASSEPPGTQPPPTSSPMGTESPLQKLLIQLQRSSQSATTLATSATPPTVAGPASSLGSVPPPASMALDKGSSDQQYDAIQSLMSQLTKMQIPPPDAVQDDHRQRELEQKRIEDERRQFEEQKRAEEERIKIQEIRLQEERLKEEERRKELEAKNQRLEEELRRIQEEQVKRRKEQENKLKETEKKLENQQKVVDATKKDEEQKRQQQHLKKQRQEEEVRKREEARKASEEEERRKEEHRIKIEQKRKEEEERKKKEEKERQLQIHVQEEMRRIALEEERRRMQQLEEEARKKQQQEEEEQARRQQQKAQQQQQKVPAPEKTKPVVPAWNTVQIVQEKNAAAPSLAEIQKTQEIKERKEREAEAVRENQRQKEAQRQAMEEKRQKEANMKWASRVSQNSKGEARGVSGPKSLQPPIKSLLEIQKEEEKEFKKRQEKEQAERAATISHLSLNAAGVWGSASQSLSWANRASSATIPSLPISTPQVSQQQAWGASPSTVAWSAIAQSKLSPGLTNESSIAWNPGSNLNNSVGFWENPDTVKGSSKPSGTSRSPPKGHAPQSQPSAKSAGIQAVNSNKTNKKKSKDESENARKLFVDSLSPADSFTQWCKVSLHSMKVHASIDIPTFVGFLADVESPYEVHDYIRSYLGDSKEVKEFAKQYLERRSKARNAQKEKYEDDNILAPAPAVNPGSGLELTEIKSTVYSVHSQTRLKRGRKKMQKVNSSILGFNVNALESVDVEDGN